MEKEKDFISKFNELTEENQRYVVAVQQALVFAQSTSERTNQQEIKRARVKCMCNIVFDEDSPVTSDQLIWALFGKSTEDVARMFRDGKNGEYAYLFKKKDAAKEKKKVE